VTDGTRASGIGRAGSKLIEAIPAPLRPWLSRFQRPAARYLAAAKYRRKYGGQFVSMIDDDDDLLHYGLEFASAYPAFRYYHAVRMYLEGGEWNAAEVKAVLDDVGLPLGDAGSVLEFACGYGRLTRHFVPTIGASKLTVSDIDGRAVDFVKERFGVDGFYSTTTACELINDGRYDVIVVVSLFSHLSIEDWGPWLRRLHQMLNTDGVLLFSTHNIKDAGENHAGENAAETKADGFLYREQNETRGRLNPERYGTAYVSEQYVERAVSENSVGRLLTFSPGALMGGQDAYVLQRINEPN
jgi:2-polyprenyl-3-methyl-5-hydroxy-6-metoxy-1,4-benzoquinol methylase